MAAVFLLMATVLIVVTDSVAIQLSYLLIGVILFQRCMNALISLSTNRRTNILQWGQR